MLNVELSAISDRNSCCLWVKIWELTIDYFDNWIVRSDEVATLLESALIKHSDVGIVVNVDEI